MFFDGLLTGQQVCMLATSGAVMAGGGIMTAERQASQPRVANLGRLLRRETAASHMHLTGDLVDDNVESV